MNRRLIAPTLLVCLVASIGCDQQQTAAELITTVGVAVTSLEAIEGNTANMAQIQKDFAAASSLVANWKQGTPSRDVVQALNLLVQDVTLIPASPQDQARIALAAMTVGQIISMIDPANANGITVYPRALTVIQPAKNSKDFKAKWNALVAITPGAPAVFLK